MKLENLLEKPDDDAFYDLMGGLSDNLLTVGRDFAGTFFSCGYCGVSFSTNNLSWTCNNCGKIFEVKFEPVKKVETGVFQTKATVKHLEKAHSTTPNWYYVNENWTVAEFVTQVLRLQPEFFLPEFLESIGIKITRPSILETTLCWPRFSFAGKTIQPDWAIGFKNDFILVEFKGPRGGKLPGKQVLGQLAFALKQAKILQKQWHLLLVPGPDKSVSGDGASYFKEALDSIEEAKVHWSLSEGELEELKEINPNGKISVIGWESLVGKTIDTISAKCDESWTPLQTIRKLDYMRVSRAQHKYWQST